MKSFLSIFLFACLFLLLHEPLFSWWCGTGIGRLLGSVDSSALNDWLSLALAIVGSVLMCLLPGRLSANGNKWGGIICGGLLFILLIESVAFNNNFVHFQSFPWLRYSDSLVVALVAFMVASCVTTSRRKSKQIMVEDRKERKELLRYDDNSENDFLGRFQLVSNILKCITEDKGNEKGATGIAITGGWGSGKSWLLSQLKSSLEQDDEICLNFSPWLYGETDIARQYYRMLERGLKLHGLETENLKRAVTEIDNDQLHGFGRFILSVFGIATNGQGREKTVEQIKTKLGQTGRKIFVFIDDCDRLAKAELMQVLSLIRNTGDFPYITYIMAFDKQVVEKTIGNDIGMNYVAKMFNLTIDLPPVNDVVLSDYLHSAAYRILGVENRNSSPFLRVPITSILPTVREAKKYLNLLYSDYKRLEERLRAHPYNEGDFCLVELLKYKFPEAYYQLQSAPETYLSYEAEGWNSPLGVLKEDVIEGNDRLPFILKALFKNGDNEFADNHTLSVAGKEYFPMYFEKELKGNFVDGESFRNALQEGKLPERIGEWLEKGYQGVLSLFCAVNGSLSKKEFYNSMTSYIWHKCEKQEHVSSINKMTYGYEGSWVKHNFKNIMKLIASTPQIGLMSFQHINIYKEDDVSKEDAMGTLIQESQYPLELMGIWMSELNRTSDTEYPYSDARTYVLKLWQRLVKMAREDESLTLCIIDILGSCSLEDTFNTMVLPLVVEDPKRWLGATVIRLSYGKNEYYLLKSRGIHALFGSLRAMYKEMEKICDFVREEDRPYVNEYKSLIYGLAAITVNKRDSSIDDKYKSPETLNVERFASLKEGRFLGIGPAMPIDDALKQIQSTPFWKGKGLRIRRKDPGYYFGTEI